MIRDDLDAPQRRAPGLETLRTARSLAIDSGKVLSAARGNPATDATVIAAQEYLAAAVRVLTEGLARMAEQ